MDQQMRFFAEQCMLPTERGRTAIDCLRSVRQMREKSQMWTARNVVSGLASISLLIAYQAQANGACDMQALLHQQKDTATIQQLEISWNTAIAQGNTSLERCLLT